MNKKLTLVLGCDEVLYLVTTGSYDDYQIVGVFSGPPGLNLASLARDWVAAHPEKAARLDSMDSGKDIFDDGHFREYVLRVSGLRPVGHKELWLPDYAPDMKRLVEGEEEEENCPSVP